MNRSVEIFSPLQCFLAGGCFEHCITHAFQIFSGHFTNGFRVLSEQDCFAATECGYVQSILLGLLGGLVDPLEIYLKGGALIWLTVNPNVSAALFDDPVDRG